MAIIPLQLARVSNQLRSSVSTQTIAKTQKSLLDVQNELTTGKRLPVASADPGDAAVVQQLRKTLEQRAAYLDNLKSAGSHLGEVDSTLGELTDLLQEAQTIGSAHVGSDITADQRKSAAAVVEALYSQVLTVANKQFDGTYIFAGDRLTDPPFVAEAGGVRFVGSDRVLSNAYDENTIRTFMVRGDQVFGALSTRVEGTVNLAPRITTATRLADLTGANNAGIRLGSIQISNGSVSSVVDLSGADTVGDVIDAINGAAVGGITASIAGDGVSFNLSATGADDITVNEVGGGTTAADLGIWRINPAGAGVGLDGPSVNPRLTPLTRLTEVPGLTFPASIRITNGLATADVNFDASMTVEDMLNAINGSGTSVRAEINATGTGINILNPTQGTRMTIAENGGSTAAQLGVRSFGADSPIGQLNFGRGVRTVDGADFTITASAGAAFDVDANGAATVQDILTQINAASTAAGAGVTASFAGSGNGIVITDTAGGAAMLSLVPANFSEAAKDLGLLETPGSNVITGTDVSAFEAIGVFSNLQKLREALEASDAQAITEASEGLKEDLDRVVRIRGEAGTRLNELESRRDRLEDQDIATKGLLSSLEDTDFTDAIARFHTLQTALQASMQTTAQVLNLSLLDFLD